MNMLMKKITLILMMALFSITAAAGEKPLSLKKGVAIQGYDAVAYFTKGKAEKGSSALVAMFKGAKWYFSSEEHKNIFITNPEKYAPQYGGYCAFAIANDKLAPTDPKAFTIVNDKLYLNYSMSVRKRWVKDIPGYVTDGDSNWANR